MQYCRDYFLEFDPLYLVPASIETPVWIKPDLNETMVTIGIMAASVVITHFLLGAISTCTKSEIILRQRPALVKSESYMSEE